MGQDNKEMRLRMSLLEAVQIEVNGESLGTIKGALIAYHRNQLSAVDFARDVLSGAEVLVKRAQDVIDADNAENG
jgi:hypothetical protein